VTKRTDYELLNGDSDDFTKLYNKYSEGIEAFLYLYKLVRSYSDVPDILQLVWIRVHGKRAMYDPQWAFSTWISQMALHVALNFYRDRNILNITTNASFLPYHVDPRETQDAAEVAEIRERVREAVAALPDKVREAIELVYFSNTRFAQETCHPGYKRGRRLLRKSLKGMRYEL